MPIGSVKWRPPTSKSYMWSFSQPIATWMTSCSRVSEQSATRIRLQIGGWMSLSVTFNW